MTKIDMYGIKIRTSEIREAIDPFLSAVDGTPQPIQTAEGFRAFGKVIFSLCNAYDEAQKEIERLNTLIKFQGEISVEKTQRISTLEALLSKILNVEFWGSQCSICGMPKQILGDGLNMQNHKSDCLFTRARKVLEGK